MATAEKRPRRSGALVGHGDVYFLSLVGAWAGVLLSLLPLVPATGAVVMPDGAFAFAAGAGVPGVVASLVPPAGLAAGPGGVWSAPLPRRAGGEAGAGAPA